VRQEEGKTEGKDKVAGILEGREQNRKGVKIKIDSVKGGKEKIENYRFGKTERK
jgi:hypothetical protein